MHKIFPAFILLSFIALSSCSSDGEIKTVSENAPDSTIFFPVTDFLLGQLNETEMQPVTPLKITTINGSTDSAWLTRDDIRVFAQPFLTPLIDSANMSAYFSGKSFMDASLNLFTLTYAPGRPLPDSLNLQRWDVYIDPVHNKVQRIYMVKEEMISNESRVYQLTWMTDEWCSIRTITTLKDGKATIKEEKLIWDFK